jgi:hypothetical protein
MLRKSQQHILPHYSLLRDVNTQICLFLQEVVTVVLFLIEESQYNRPRLNGAVAYFKLITYPSSYLCPDDNPYHVSESKYFTVS